MSYFQKRKNRIKKLRDARKKVPRAFFVLHFRSLQPPSLQVFLIHGRLFLHVYLLLCDLFDPQEALSSCLSPPVRPLWPTGGFPFKIASSCADFLIFRMLLSRKVVLFLTSLCQTKRKKDQMHFHTSDLNHNFKFISIFEKEPF